MVLFLGLWLKNYRPLYIMPGGLLNLVAYGNQNVILNGNPSKTFFKTTYAKYSNFGLQRFRLDFNGQRTLRLTDQSVFEFTVPRYADLLMDTYLVVNLPNIWSPIVPPICGDPSFVMPHPAASWQPYDFKWIDNIGSQLIETVRFKVGGQIVQELTGQYILNMVERDFDDAKKNLFYRMTGNVAELNDPANADGRSGFYPSAGAPPLPNGFGSAGVEPSIRGRQLYIPLNIWFTMAAKMAFPIVALQYSELTIELTLRSIQDLFVVRNISETADDYSRDYIQIDPTSSTYGFYKFLQSPPPGYPGIYEDKRTNWNADVHLLATYCFLSDDEVRIFAGQPQTYLVRQVYTTLYENVVGSRRIDVRSLGMVTNYMWFLQRSDAYKRNEWSNYTNWPYKHIPFNVESVMPPGNPQGFPVNTADFLCNGINLFPNLDTSGNFTTIALTGIFKVSNAKDIMQTWGLLLDGKYREDPQPVGVFDYVEKYTRTSGGAKEGLYCYNFCLHTNPTDFQPSGAMNMSKFTTTEFELTTMLPVLDQNAQFRTICNNDGDVIGTIKPAWGIYQYTYNMVVMEERYNVLKFVSGTAGLEWAR